MDLSGFAYDFNCFRAKPLPDQSDFYQNKLRPQPPHRVLEPPVVRKPVAAPESGLAPYLRDQGMTSPMSPSHQVLSPEQDLMLPEVPEYDAPMILEESSESMALMDTPHASGPAKVTRPPENSLPFAVTREQIHGHFLHGDKSNAMPPIPAAVRQPVWKTPYSYGYFGAGRKRQWTLHYGFPQTYTQWTLR